MTGWHIISKRQMRSQVVIWGRLHCAAENRLPAGPGDVPELEQVQLLERYAAQRPSELVRWLEAKHVLILI